LGGRPGGEQRRLLHWLELPHARPHALVVAPVARTGADANPLYAWLDTLEQEKLAQERRRLLYVAATRAKRWLHLFGSAQVIDDPDEPTVRRPVAGSALGYLWPAVRATYDERLAELGTVSGEPMPAMECRPLLRRVPLDWTPQTLPRAPRIESRAVTRGAPGPAVEFDWATETARHVGTVVHRELQRITRDAVRPDVFKPELRRRWLDELAELGVPAGLRPGALERVAEAVARTLADGRGRWLLDAGHRESATELALTGRVGGQVASVVIDRSFVDASGARWIVDYKTSRHEGAGLEAFLDREQERYRPQLERYAAIMRSLGPEPVRLGLYFPLLGAWREW
jgi:hypothetical protein